MATRACKSHGMLPNTSAPPLDHFTWPFFLMSAVLIPNEYRGIERTCCLRYLGKGVTKAVENINKTISPGIAVRPHCRLPFFCDLHAFCFRSHWSVDACMGCWRGMCKPEGKRAFGSSCWTASSCSVMMSAEYSTQ